MSRISLEFINVLLPFLSFDLLLALGDTFINCVYSFTNDLSDRLFWVLRMIVPSVRTKTSFWGLRFVALFFSYKFRIFNTFFIIFFEILKEGTVL